MSFLLTFALAVTLAAPAGPIATIEPDTGAVALRELLRSTPGRDALDPGQGYLNAKGAEHAPLNAEDALALLQSEHHFSIPLLLLEDPSSRPPDPATVRPSR
jgi:hypothetical protein